VLAAVVVQLMQQRESVKQIIYEVTGLADVVRGVSKATETLGAQQLKANYSNSRTGPRLKDIQKFARDIYRLKAEVIAEKFSPQTLAQMTGFDLAMNDAEKQALQTQAQALQASGQPMPPELAKKLKQPTWESVMALLRDEKLRGFRVDIETDSTVQPDAAEEQKNRIELLTAITGFVEGIGPAVQSGAVPKDLAKEMLSFGVRAFKVSPQLEDALDALGGDDAEGNEQGQEAQQQAQMQQQVQEAQAQIAEQQKAAEGTIQQAKDAKHAADMQAMKLGYETKLAQQDIALREAKLEIKAAQIAKSEKDALDRIGDGLRDAETREATAQGVKEMQDMTEPLARMEQMHASTIAAFAEMVERLTAPRKRIAIRGPDGRMTGAVDQIA